MKNKGIYLTALAFATSIAQLSMTARAEDFGVTNDLWDVHTGTVITATSGFQSSVTNPGMFGGADWPSSPITTHFADGQTDGFTHFVEWRTHAAVTIKRVRLFAAGDGEIYDHGREMGRFTLKVKSPGSATFDTTVLTFVPTHPYTELAEKHLMLDAAIDEVTASEFRGEFEQIDLRAAGWNAPRVIELDAYGSEPPVVTPPPEPISSSVPSSEDLWDVSRGTILTRSSPVYTELKGPGFLGGAGYVGEFGDTIFADRVASTNSATISSNQFPYPYPFFPSYSAPTNGYVHFAEWKTVTPVTVSSIRLFASGDGEQYQYGREMARFTLKTKSTGSSEFDTTVFTFVPSHPYFFLNPDSRLILETNLQAFSGQEFRGEFEHINQRAEGWNAPRVIELDAFGAPPPPQPIIFGHPGATNVWAGADAVFSVSATGQAPLIYTWQHNGTNVVLSSRIESNGKSLRIHAVTPDDAGDYAVIVSNTAGQAQSNPATLTVNLDTNGPVIVLTSPAAGFAGSAAIRLEGRISDNVSVVTASWQQNGAPGGSLSSSNSFFSIPITLLPGTNVLKVVAVDSSGNEGAAEVSVSVSPTAQSSVDLWDITRGTVVTASSPVLSESGGPGLFGGGGFVGEPGDTIFQDDSFRSIILIPGSPLYPRATNTLAQTNVVKQTNGYIHFIEWKTVEAVTISNIRLYASGDGATYSYGREMGRFTLKTKSAGGTNFDTTILSFVPSHPYTFLDSVSLLILNTNVPAFTAQEFRGEFEQINLRDAGWNAPRVIELDAFGPVAVPEPSIRAAALPRVASASFITSVQFSSDGTAHLVMTAGIGSTYLITASSDMENWSDLGAYVCTDGTIQIDDPAANGAGSRFYKAILLSR
jgi:hypothetical protein